MDEDERATVTERAARAGADVAFQRFRTPLSTDTKSGKNDVVTDADRDSQEQVVACIRDRYPGESLVGEEDGADARLPETGPAWIVDPIDGTNNYLRGSAVWATAVAAVVDGVPVAEAVVAPALSETFLGGPDGVTVGGTPVGVSDRSDPETFLVGLAFGTDAPAFGRLFGRLADRFGRVRRLGSAQITFGMVAAGHLDAAIGAGPAPVWDTVAGVDLIRRAGGRVTDADGNRWEPGADRLVASNGEAHDALLTAVE